MSWGGGSRANDPRVARQQFAWRGTEVVVVVVVIIVIVIVVIVIVVVVIIVVAP